MTLQDLLVEHSSPTLAGIKCASLVNLSRLDSHSGFPGKELREKGLSFMSIRTVNGTSLLLVYRKEKIGKVIRDTESEKILLALGYDTSSAGKCLEKLRTRFLSEPCPHEVGIFLGYPPEDVRGFIENEGNNPLLSGMWKVYSSVERAMRIFSQYERCRKIYSSLYRNGTSIERLCVTA